MKIRFTSGQPTSLKSIKVKSDPTVSACRNGQFTRQLRSTSMRNGRRKIRRHNESTLTRTI